MKAKAYRVTLEMVYTLPADLNEREDMYGTSDPVECVKIDMDNDPLAVISEASWLDVVDVRQVV